MLCKYKFQNFSTLNYILQLFNYFVSTSGLHNKRGGESDGNKRPFLWPVMQLEWEIGLKLSGALWQYGSYDYGMEPSGKSNLCSVVTK